MPRFCIVIDGREPDGGAVKERHDQAQGKLEQLQADLRRIGMGVTYCAMLTPSDEQGSDDPAIVFENGQRSQELVDELGHSGSTAEPPAQEAAPPPEPTAVQPAGVDDSAAYKCPGCGATADEPTTCTGTGEYGHEPIAMLPTDEVVNAPADAAPAAGEQAQAPDAPTLVQVPDAPGA